MINSIPRHELLMDFSTIDTEKGKPSDIDMYYTGTNYVIFGEIKHYSGEFTNEQRRLYEKLANDVKYKDVVCLYITHDKRVESGVKRVLVADCYVTEYYYCPKYEKGYKYNSRWKIPEHRITVNEFMIRFINKENEKLEKEKLLK